jgi:hypothetical protein
MRGFTAEEVEMAIRQSNWIPGTRGRFECSMEFPFDSIWNGKPYQLSK